MEEMLKERILGFERRLANIYSTQKELVERSGVSNSTISHWRKFAVTGRGRRPKLPLVKTVDEALVQMEEEYIAFNKKRPRV